LTREDFVGVFTNAVAGLGFCPDAAMVTFPIDLFLTESDLGPVRARKQEFYRGLTTWRPHASETGLRNAPMISVPADSYEDAYTRANNLFLTNMWGDGLPIVPPTTRQVDWILEGAVLPRDHVVGKFLPRGGVTTVESVAVALAMAGGRPEYLPILLAAVEAVLDAAGGHEMWQAASGSAFPVVIVNGPIARQVRVSSGFGLLGPDPQRPAGASIGRALRLLQQNVGGALPGVGAMAIFGGMRFTNAVFAEDEEGLPAGWLPHATERHGYAAGTNSVSVAVVSGATNVKRRGVGVETAEQECTESLWRVADYLRTPNLHCLSGYDTGTPGVLMMPSVVAQRLAELGWTKASIKEFLWTNSRIPLDHVRRAGMLQWIEADTDPVTKASAALDPWPITSKPENLILLVAGGHHPTNNYWLQGYCRAVVGRPISLPDNWSKLLERSMRDIGCGSDVCMI
jgi:hypothetical protein